MISPETIDREQAEHMAQVAADNALWHRHKYKATGDREHLGQWKAYARCAWALRCVEYSGAQQPATQIESCLSRLRTERKQVECSREATTAERRVFVCGVIVASVAGATLPVVLKWL
jgi:hypothetical protein